MLRIASEVAHVLHVANDIRERAATLAVLIRREEELVVEVDAEIQGYLASFATIGDLDSTPPARTKKRTYQRQHYEPKARSQ